MHPNKPEPGAGPVSPVWACRRIQEHPACDGRVWPYSPALLNAPWRGREASTGLAMPAAALRWFATSRTSLPLDSTDSHCGRIRPSPAFQAVAFSLPAAGGMERGCLICSSVSFAVPGESKIKMGFYSSCLPTEAANPWRSSKRGAGSQKAARDTARSRIGPWGAARAAEQPGSAASLARASLKTGRLSHC